MTVREITQQYLIEHGYDGLYSVDYECGCENEDLFPCGGEMILECEPGYKQKCDCGDHDWHIGIPAPRRRRREKRGEQTKMRRQKGKHPVPVTGSEREG